MLITLLALRRHPRRADLRARARPLPRGEVGRHLGAPVLDRHRQRRSRDSRSQRGETEYAISWLPLGGYVKMASREEEARARRSRAATPEAEVPPDRIFEAKPVWKRMIVHPGRRHHERALRVADLHRAGAQERQGGQSRDHGRSASTRRCIPAGAEALRDAASAGTGSPRWTASRSIRGTRSMAALAARVRRSACRSRWPTAAPSLSPCIRPTPSSSG